MEALRSELSGWRLIVPEIDAIFNILRRDMPEDSWEHSNILTVEAFSPPGPLPRSLITRPHHQGHDSEFTKKV